MVAVPDNQYRKLGVMMTKEPYSTKNRQQIICSIIVQNLPDIIPVYEDTWL